MFLNHRDTLQVKNPKKRTGAITAANSTAYPPNLKKSAPLIGCTRPDSGSLQIEQKKAPAPHSTTTPKSIPPPDAEGRSSPPHGKAASVSYRQALLGFGFVPFCLTITLKKIEQRKPHNVRRAAQSPIRLALHLLAQRLWKPRREPCLVWFGFHSSPTLSDEMRQSTPKK